ncbi:hypothetical protein GDI3578 [Gluconacetobacter diazotrophicus PA1 5]|uniref:Uncharacterized protein n=2 Tax=Gluconacetobacter diazotrophicus TaxID=33996 RepID=A9H6N1_GLUDA|nr:hypothetical protein GDI3578 [Gluconacetobacter diazotrophicus PA1 5]
MLSHSCLSDLTIGKEAYKTRLYGDGKGGYVGATREDGGACAIAHVGRLVTVDGKRVLELTGYLTTPAQSTMLKEA